MLRNLYILCVILLVSGAFIFAQNKQNSNFEGTIKYQRSDLDDTLVVKMYFKGDKVRIDYYTKDNTLFKYKIFDFATDRMLIINPEKKLYVERSIDPNTIPLDSDAEITKTGNHKTILGKEAYQWIVKNTKRNTVVSYWVLPGSYDYYSYMFEAMGRTNKIIGYYSHIPENRGFILLEAEEFSLVRDRRMRFRAIEIDKESPDPRLFELPKNYELFE
jgi:hypothetical protein